ncbi:TetR/AcrR family transcriptional regulator [Sporosarcina sp. SAFN-010]|uniref:TetR/AcrR family transcriptional regulator n=1 Tax=Sporosarcina sp. SAFN-010 TaxID=3387273 RepID=UPI003F81B21B
MARSKEFNENEVLQKAMELFWKQGYEKTSMQDLVEYMGIHRRSIYDTFGDKHSLFLKTLQRYDNQIEAKITTHVNTQESPCKAIRQLFMLAILRDELEPVGCLAVNSAVELSLHDFEVRELVSNSFSKTEQLLYALVQKGQKTGEVSSQFEAKKLSDLLHNSLVGLRVLAKTTNDKKKLEGIIDMTLSMLK